MTASAQFLDISGLKGAFASEVDGTTGTIEPEGWVFSARFRRAAMLYVAATIPLAALISSRAHDALGYVASMYAIGFLYTAPLLVLAAISVARCAPRDRRVWRVWASCMFVGTTLCTVGYLSGPENLEQYRGWSVPSVAAFALVLMAANTVMLRSRSGGRAVLIDGIDIGMATLSFAAIGFLLVGEAIVTSENAWLTAASAIWILSAVHGGLVALTIRARVSEGQRQVANAGIALAIATVIGATAQIIHGLNDFEYPHAPFGALFALQIGVLALFFVHSRSLSSQGLERLPLTEQVRRHSLLVAVVIVALPALAAAAWLRQDESWSAPLTITALVVLMALSGIRHLLTGPETARLYAMVEHAAAERGELLSEVMAHLDEGRHQAAAHVHRQAVSLYAAIAPLASALEGTTGDGASSPVVYAAEQLRRDLGRQADALQKIAKAIKPMARPNDHASLVAAPIRAFVERLYGDRNRPELLIDVDPDLRLDWTTESALLRIAQDAISNIWAHARASTIRIDVRGALDGVHLLVADDGVGFDAGAEGRGFTSMRALARFLEGDITIESRPGEGTTVRAHLAKAPSPAPMAEPAPPARLHLVPRA